MRSRSVVKGLATVEALFGTEGTNVVQDLGGG